ncbi:MAG TPA: hypothetical protein VN700_09480 [Vicinamibacterales bacterium]|nr:hypothetical protein [Vicinamibacterales bacterium]
MTHDDRLALDELDQRLRTLLPDTYKEAYAALKPVPMRSAPLKYDSTGQVAWNDIWGSFCDLAMAGGPPHKGRLLGPGTSDGSPASDAAIDAVVTELCRGIELTTTMPCEPASAAGWVRVECYSETMAAWLLRAIVMENVAAKADGRFLSLPASPAFRLDKEIKNVITVIAKTTHYWLEHMPRAQQRAIAHLLSNLDRETPLVAPRFEFTSPARDFGPLAAQINRLTGLVAMTEHLPEWLGLECGSVAVAIWLMRALITQNILARREDEVLWVPINAVSDPNGARVATALSHVHRLAILRGVTVARPTQDATSPLAGSPSRVEHP